MKTGLTAFGDSKQIIRIEFTIPGKRLLLRVNGLGYRSLLKSLTLYFHSGMLRYEGQITV